jgi:hypothetical protein
LLPVCGLKQVVGAHLEVAGACVAVNPVLLHHEKAVAVDRDIGVDAGGDDVALREIGWFGTYLDTRALLDRIASAIRSEILIEQVGKLDLLVLVTNCRLLAAVERAAEVASNPESGIEN